MIKINLVPIDELENQLWWLADAAILAIFAFASFFGAQYYLGEIQKNVDETTTRAQSLEDNANALEPEIARFANLKEKKISLNEKLESLKKITVTKISKFEPVIVLEHMQNLKPEGVWFTRLQIGSPAKGAIKIEGQGFDNLLVAEFMTNIRSTELQEKDDADLRTHIYFTNLDLITTAVKNTTSGTFPDVQSYPTFEINGVLRDKGEMGLPTGMVPAIGAPPEIPDPIPVSLLDPKVSKKMRF